MESNKENSEANGKMMILCEPFPSTDKNDSLQLLLREVFID